MLHLRSSGERWPPGRRCAAIAGAIITLALAAVPGVALATDALWVTQSASSDTSNVLAFTIQPDDSLSAPIAAGVADEQSTGIAVTPVSESEYGNEYVYVTNDGASSVSQYSVNAATGALTLLPQGVATVDPGSGNPNSITVDPSGSWAYTTNPTSNSVTVLRIAPGTGELTPVQEFSSSSSPSVTLSDPTGVAIDPTGNYLYVANNGGNDVAEFVLSQTTGALTPIGTVAMPAGATATPEQIVSEQAIGGMNPDDYLYVTDSTNDEVAEFLISDTDGSLSALATPEVSTNVSPVGLVVDPSSGTLYVAAQGANLVDEFTINTTNTNTGELTAAGSQTTGDSSAPSALALAPDGNELYVGHTGDSAIGLFPISGGVLGADDPDTVGDATAAGPSTPAAAELPSTPSSPPAPIAGALSQLAANDCVTSDRWASSNLALGCNTPAAGPEGSMSDSFQAVVSADGKSVYDVAPSGDLDEFTRDPATGALTYLGCLSGGSDCGSGNDDLHGMNGPQAITLSPDGKSAYVVTAGDDALVELTRDVATGLLSYQGCFSKTDGSCTSSVGIDNPYGVTVSPDGSSVYATSFADSSVIEFSRATNGALTAQGCLTTDSDSSTNGGCGSVAPGGDAGDLMNAADVAVSPDGDNAYVVSGGTGYGGDIVEFSRNTTNGAISLVAGNTCITSMTMPTMDYPNCTTTNAVGFDRGAETLAISPDDKNVYVNAFGDNGVIELSRAADGTLSQLGGANACIAEETSPAGTPSCTQIASPQQHGTAGALGVAISPDGLDVYVSGSGDNAVSSFSRDLSNHGALLPLPIQYGCITGGSQYTAGTCPDYNTNGLYNPRRLVVSPDGNSVYVANQDGANGTFVGGDGIVELERETPSAHVSVGESGAPSSAVVGTQITYTYSVTNSGPSSADEPVLTVPLASELALQSVASSQGSCSGTNTVTCRFGVLADGGSATVAITADLARVGTATQTASVAYATDPSNANHSVTTTTTINAPVAAPPAPSVAPPVLSKSTDAAPVAGTVLVKLPGSNVFVALSTAENIPMGSTIDATNGTVAITVALPNGTTETGDFYDGEFVVTQAADGRVFETLTGGSFVGCPVAGKTHKHKKGEIRLAAAKKKSTTVVRQLWGNAHGDFTTKGRYGSAAVSGTIWLTQDRCDGTYFKVTKDTIVVVAFAHPSKVHNLKQGQSILIPKP
jgi:uncharacterized repeat protein (TIGR01451 family)